MIRLDCRYSIHKEFESFANVRSRNEFVMIVTDNAKRYGWQKHDIARDIIFDVIYRYFIYKDAFRASL